MSPRRWLPFRALLPALLLGLLFGGPPFSADEPAVKTSVAESAKQLAGKSKSQPTALTKDAPQSVADLLEIQAAIEKVVEKALPATVAVRIDGTQGSGVIVSEDGYVLTAGHVAANANREATLIFPDGKRVKAKTLGINDIIDSGLMKITEEGKWPYVEMGKSGNLKPGEWCVAIGHNGGYQTGRPPMVRAGRVLQVRDDAVWTDCTLVGGDSGGPLLDSSGQVIGIHSRIADSVTANFHVPIDTYHDTWKRLVRGDVWPPRRGGPVLGVNGQNDPKGCRLAKVFPESPAEQAGLRVDDVVISVGDDKVEGVDDLVSLISQRRPGDTVTLAVVRGEEELQIKAKLTRRQ